MRDTGAPAGSSESTARISGACDGGSGDAADEEPASASI